MGLIVAGSRGEMHSFLRRPFTALIIAWLLCGTAFASAQTPLSEVEVRLDLRACRMITCPPYQVVVHGTGVVEYHNDGTDERRVRNISPDDAIALVNKFLAAGFMDARDVYRDGTALVRRGDVVELGNITFSEPGDLQLTLRIGSRTKSVLLISGYPPFIRELIELVDRLGGSQAWTGQ